MIGRVDVVDREELRILAEHRAPPQVSIYLPRATNLSAAEGQLRRLVGDVGRRLRRAGAQSDATPPPVRALEAAMRRGLGRHPSALAGFASRRLLRVLPLPDAPASASAGERFRLAPLLAYVDTPRFSVLTLGIGANRLYEASAFGLRRRDDVHLPQHFSDVRPDATSPPSLGQHPTKPDARDRGNPAGPVGARHEGVVQLLRVVDERVARALRTGSPVVLVTRPHWARIYRNISHLPGLAEDHVDRDPSALNEEALWRAALACARPALDAQRAQDLKLASHRCVGLHEVLPAAIEGRIATLFVRRGARRAGRYDRSTREVVFETPTDDGPDLVERTIREALLRGVRVHLVDALPAEVSARLRH